MTKEELLNKAVYIQFPYNNEYYADWYVNKYGLTQPVVNMPIIKNVKNILYNKMPGNEHHYTTYYHRMYVMPIISQILSFNFNKEDFNLIENKTELFDISYLLPKNKYTFTVTTFQNNVTNTFTYNELMPIENNMDSPYRYLYKYFHQCSRIVNNELQNNKKLFISGDSQMIPSILMLACYYKEVWYFDNRTGHIWENGTLKEINYDKFKQFNNEYKDIVFDDVLIELYTNPLNWYTEINLL